MKAILLCLFLLFSCRPTSADSPADADLLLLGGRIYTVNAEQPWASAMAVRDGEIIYIGTGAGARRFQGNQTRVVRLGGRVALPGLHDSHIHLLEAFHDAFTCALTAGRDPESAIRVLRACAPDQAGTRWVLGVGHSIFDLLDHVASGGRSPREILDEAIPHRPVAILEQTSHSVWANSLALEAAGFRRGAANPPGGVILRDRSGEPNGILIDGAGEKVLDLALRPTPQLHGMNYRALLRGLRQVNRHGITSVADARAYWQRGYVEAWKRVEREGRLSVRAVVGLWAYPYLDDGEQISRLADLYSNDPSSRLRFSQVKIYSDGEISHTSAALLEPYQDYRLAGPRGLEYFSGQRLQRYIRELEKVGFDFHIHAIGDRGVHKALNAIQATAAQSTAAQATGRDRRHRLTHIEMVQPSDVPRFKKLDVIADMQMSFSAVEPRHLRENELSLGRQRVNQRLWRLRDLHDAGARIVLSSDYDVGEMSPFAGMQRALTRGSQSLPNLPAAIRAYTINAAYLIRQEDRVGSLEVGKRADVVVLDRDIFNIPKRRIGATRVLRTFIDGEEVWRDPRVGRDGL